jgi:hypothetical protein
MVRGRFIVKKTDQIKPEVKIIGWSKIFADRRGDTNDHA